MYYLHDQSPFLLWKKKMRFFNDVSVARGLSKELRYTFFFFTLKQLFFFVNKLRLTKYNYKNIIRIFLGRESQL